MSTSGQNVNIPALIRATQGLDNNARGAATKQLDFLRDNNFSNYMFELCRILGSPNEQTTIRQGAGLLLKNCVGGARSEQQLNAIQKRWAQQPDQVRQRLKETILKVLGVSNQHARDTAVNVISNLVKIEPLTSWSNLLPTLIQHCQSKDLYLMYSSLKCIAQIAEDESSHTILQSYSAKILQCIAHAMSAQKDDVQSEAMKCLSEIVEFIEPNMQIEKERNIIFQMVCVGASNGPNEQLRLNAFQCIRRLIECYYHLLSSYMQSIFQISKNAIEKGIKSGVDQEVTKQAIEVWSTCADIELDIIYEQEEQKKANTKGNTTRTNFGFVNKALELLVPVYLNALLQQTEGEDEDEWTVRKAAACSLELFAQTAKDKILNFVLKFVEQHIASKDNWRRREAAICAFGYILEGPAKSKLVGLTSQILPVILNLMSDSNAQVRASSVWAFGRVCDAIPDAVGNKNVIEEIAKALNEKNIICEKACWCIASLTQYYAAKNGGCIYEGSNTFKLIQEMLKRRDRSDSSGRTVTAIHEAMNNIIYYVPQNEGSKKMVESLLPVLVGQLLECAQKAQSGDNSDILMYKMAGLFGTIQVIIGKLGEGCLDQNNSNKIMFCCCSLLSADNDLCYEEALGCITYVARCIGDKFSNFLVEGQVQELLLKAIRIGARNENICRIAVGVVGDVFTSCTDWINSNANKIENYSDRTVSELLTMLIDTEVDMELKGHIVDALTDILISHGSRAKRYSADILDKCLEIGKLVPPKDTDMETMEIFNEIRCSIVDTCRTCMGELAQSNQIHEFQKYLPKIHLFFNAMANDSNRISVQVLESCIKLLCEAADFCDVNTKKQLQTPSVSKLLHQAGSMSRDQPELAQQAKMAYDQIAKI